MSVELILVLPDGKQREIPLAKPVQVIGRQTDCQIRILSDTISRHHCEVAVGDDKVSVRDLGSSNGTFVNRRRVTQAEVAAGDLIAIGDLVFVVRVNGRPAAIDSDDVIEDGQVKPEAAPPPRAAKPAATKSATAKPTPAADPGGSSVGDFDFLNEDDEIRKQPKL